MTPQSGQRITIVFENNIQISGIVVSWSDQKSVIKTSAGASHTVINKTLEDVMFYKLFDDNIEEKLEEIIDKPIKGDDDIKNLADLKIQLNEIEREEIKEKITSHQTGNIGKVSYGIPTSILKKPDTTKHPRKEIATKDQRIANGLQRMFGKNKEQQ